MQSRTLIVALVVIILVIFAGGGIYLWQKPQQESLDTNPQQESSDAVPQQAETQTYSGDSFSAQYPSSYQVSTGVTNIITISGSNGKVMIGNFEPAAAPPTTADMTQAEIDEFPKNVVYHGYEGEIASAIFYKTGDEKAKKELESIQNSIKLK